MMSFLEPTQRFAIIEAVVHLVNRDFTALAGIAAALTVALALAPALEPHALNAHVPRGAAELVYLLFPYVLWAGVSPS